jgi:hypothetical protein
MATHKTIPSLARGDSKPIDANKPFIVRDLPAELRNQIISYLVEYPTPMRISCNSTESRPYRIDIHGFRLCPKLQLPVNLFASCRTLYRDAASAFYSNHTFIIDSRYCSYSCHLNAPFMSAIFKSILGGQLGLRKYGRLLYAVTICGDGSGGEISWGTTKLCCDPPNMMIRELLPDIIPDPHHISSFTAEDGGAQLRVHKREKALTLLDLPQPILRDIIRRVVHPIEGFVIDLDKDTKFNCGVIHVNKDIYHAWRDSFLFGHSSFELVLTTNCVHTDFGGFKKLRRVLRKTFDSSRYPPDDSSHLRTLTISAFRRNTVNYTLKFEVQGPVSLGDVRINILPFVMETAMSDSSNGNELTIQVRSTGCKSSMYRQELVISSTLSLVVMELHTLVQSIKALVHFWHELLTT